MIEVSHVTYTYPGADAPAVADVSLSLLPGERMAIMGPNGSGKSTLARLVNGGILADQGSVCVEGCDPSQGRDESREVARLVGFVRQDPTSQIVSSRVGEEVMFGPCNLGLPVEEVTRRADACLEEVGLDGFAERSVSTLSGGELQRLALAGVLAMEPTYLVLDEVLSQLDQDARVRLRALVSSRVARGMGAIQVTHDLRDLGAIDKVVCLLDGHVAWTGTPGALLSDESLLERLELTCGYPSHQAHAREMGDTLEAAEVHVSYGTSCVLDGAALAVRPGEVVCVAGPSGSGKTTLARVLAGIKEPSEGTARLGDHAVRPGMVGLAFQRPEDQVFSSTVVDDVAYGPRNLGLTDDEVTKRVDESLDLVGFDRSLDDRSPFSLSGGQRRRIALAGIAALRPRAYVFDEPTVGLDARGKASLHHLVEQLSASGAPVVVVSHEVDEWKAASDRLVHLVAGRISS